MTETDILRIYLWHCEGKKNPENAEVKITKGELGTTSRKC